MSASPAPARSTGFETCVSGRCGCTRAAVSAASGAELEAGVGEQVGREHAVPAAVGQHGHSAARLRRRRAAPGRGRPARPATPPGCRPRRAAQRRTPAPNRPATPCGTRRTGTDIGPPGLDHQRRLARLGQRPHGGDELRPVLRVFDVARHHRASARGRPATTACRGWSGPPRCRPRRTARTPAARPSAATPPRAPGCPTATPARRRRSAGRHRSRSARHACRAAEAVRAEQQHAGGARRRPGGPIARPSAPISPNPAAITDDEP